jgi:hypothetical protein
MSDNRGRLNESTPWAVRLRFVNFGSVAESEKGEVTTMIDYILGAIRGRSALEQHLAIFGRSGSGKTTLLSTFYGCQQEPAHRKMAEYGVTATDSTAGHQLHASYLKLTESLLPPPTRYSHRPVEFDIVVRGLDARAGKLVWHDYPGEWWTETKTDTEGERKIEAFKALLQSDVAFLLCDGALLRRDGSKYLRELFRGLRDELERQKEAIVDGGQRLSLCPKVWVICLSKADLFPEQNVFAFRDQVIKAAADEIEELQHLMGTIMKGDCFKAIGDEYLLLSSAQIDNDTGKVVDPTRRIGVDLIMPLAVTLPIQKAVRWSQTYSATVGSLEGAGEILRSLTTNWLKYVPLLGSVFRPIDDGAKSMLAQLTQVKESARQRGDSAGFALAALQARLEDPSSSSVFCSTMQ